MSHRRNNDFCAKCGGNCEFDSQGRKLRHRWKPETINGYRIECYDSGPGKGADRYTVVFLDRELHGYTPEYDAVRGRSDLYPCLAMSDSPFHPQGVGMHAEAMRGRHLGKRVKLADLPEDCQRLVMRDLSDEVAT